MIRLLLASLALLFVLTLGLLLFQVLVYCISALQVWQGTVWLKLRIPVMVVGVVGCFVVAVVWIHAANVKRMRDIQKSAQARGWGFSLEDSEGLRERVEALYYGRQMGPLSCIRTVETKPRAVYLFDCWYRNRSVLASDTEDRATVCLIESDRFRAITEPFVIGEHWAINKALLGEKVTLDDSPFSRQFIVYSMNPSAARRAVTLSLQSAILDYKEKSPDRPITIAMGPSGAVLLIEQTPEHERWDALIDLAHKIEEVVE